MRQHGRPVATPWPTALRAARIRVAADGFVSSYVAWREACDEVRSAYRRWTEAASASREVGFEEFNRALDREERAAGGHERWVERCRTLVG